jgi:hypothetical protein
MPQRRKFEPYNAWDILQKISQQATGEGGLLPAVQALQRDWETYRKSPNMALLGPLMAKTQEVVNHLPSGQWKKISDSIRNQRSRRKREMVKMEVSKTARERLQAYQEKNGFASMDEALIALLKKQAPSAKTSQRA